MTEHVDVVVVGLGIHGSATAASLARRGHRVIGLDRFPEGHSRGSSHGRTRMIRRAYPNPAWNGLVDRAFNAWERLERESGQVLVHRTGGLYAHRGEAQLQGPECVVVEDHSQMAQIMPGFRAPEGYRAVYDPNAGVIEADRALGVLREAARGAGARLRFGDRVEGWDTTSTGVEVRTASGNIRASKIVVTVGSWAERIVPELAGLFEVWRILTLTAAPGQPVGMPGSLGAFSVDRDEGLVFGIPDADGNGVKIGVDAGLVWDPERVVAPPSPEEIADLQTLMSSLVPGIDVTPHEVASCLYTMTADKRFVVGSLETAPEIIVGAACSGHGFKFGPAIGDALADLAEDRARADLEFISTARRGL